ncbi:cytoplasmic dynein 2 light intermediate chain 1, partial [Microplitis demolitor]|uniref:cytoplasmic dynein 2 light intermediate chain 1 n=1 Tax=Microplitis demolitor TaxID=69319 RepID=UPI00235B6016
MFSYLLIIIGDKGVGKTTMIYKFLEKDEVPKPTITLDYSFGRKANKNLSRDLIHIWEVGHLTASIINAGLVGASTQLQSKITTKPKTEPTFIIMLNLMATNTIWLSLETCLNAAWAAIKIYYDDTAIEQMKHQRLKELEAAASGNVDGKFINPFPLKLSIIGGQYDKFKKLDFVTKQTIGRILRGIAYNLGADLQYYSSKEGALIRKMKELMSYYGFNHQRSKECIYDYNHALLIPSGTVADDDSVANSAIVVDKIKRIFLTNPNINNHNNNQILLLNNDQESLNDNSIDDPNFNEAVIDHLRSQRNEEIEINL